MNDIKIPDEEFYPYEQQLQRLIKIADEWSQHKIQPAEACNLSLNEFAAVAIAAGYSEALRDPIFSFFLLELWQQQWVMTRRGLSCFIGMPIGI